MRWWRAKKPRIGAIAEDGHLGRGLDDFGEKLARPGAPLHAETCDAPRAGGVLCRHPSQRASESGVHDPVT